LHLVGYFHELHVTCVDFRLFAPK